MNIIEIQNNLKGLPDQALMDALHSPNPAAPSFLVLTELQRRKDMRNEFDARKAAAQKPLVDQLPEQMMAQLPAAGIGTVPPQEGMPADAYAQDEVHMAGGGMVGYNGDKESLVSSEGLTLDEIANSPNDYSASPVAATTEDLNNFYGPGKAPTAEQAAALTQYGKNYANKYKSSGMSPSQLNDLMSKNAARMKELQSKKSEGAGVASIPKPAEPDTLENYYKQAEKLRGPSAVDALKSEIMGQYGNIDKRLEQDKWMALSQAGFAMASSKNPHFFANLSEGAKVGVGALVAAQDSAQKAKQGLLSSRIAMAQAEDARKDGNFSLAQQLQQQAIHNKEFAMQYGLQSQQLGLMAKHYAAQAEAAKTKGGISETAYATIVDKVEKNLQNQRVYQDAQNILASPKADSVAKSKAQAMIDDLEKKTMQKYMRDYQGQAEPAARPYTDYLKK